MREFLGTGILFDIVKKKLVLKKLKLQKLISDLYNRYSKGFYVHVETKMDNAKKAEVYIGRYLKIQRDLYTFQSIDCRYEEEVPGYVVEEFIWWE